MRQTVCRFLFFVSIFAIMLSATSVLMAQMPYTTTKTGDCGIGYGAPKGRVGLHRIADPQGGWQPKGFIADSLGPMPQTAYDPNYGCYPGNQRTIHRYPAFHGNYYSSPTNYRHYAEYPWNADMAEPQPYPNQMVKWVDAPTVTPATTSVLATDGGITAEQNLGIDELVPALESDVTTEVAPFGDTILD